MNGNILNDFFNILAGGGLSYPISYPNVKFTPPNDGIWLEVRHFPNENIDDSLSSQQVIKQGLFQVSIMGRQNTGLIAIDTAAQEVAALFPKLTELGESRVSKVPYTSSVLDWDNGKVEQPLTIPYSG